MLAPFLTSPIAGVVADRYNCRDVTVDAYQTRFPRSHKPPQRRTPKRARRTPAFIEMSQHIVSEGNKQPCDQVLISMNAKPGASTKKNAAFMLWSRQTFGRKTSDECLPYAKSLWTARDANCYLMYLDRYSATPSAVGFMPG
jgi:hypothetical protein